jgi:hypothetical protein
MSVATRRALYGKMAGDATLTGLLGTPKSGYSQAIYYERAPSGAAFPYIVFSKQAGTPRYAMSARAYDDDVWQIKAVGKDDGVDLSADKVDNIASRLDALLTDGTISISGRTQLYLRRESDIDYAETADGVNYRHAGSLFRLLYE